MFSPSRSSLFSPCLPKSRNTRGISGNFECAPLALSHEIAEILARFVRRPYNRGGEGMPAIVDLRIRNNLKHARAGTIAQTPDVFKVPAVNYFDPDRWREEMSKVFKRMPLMLAMTAELREIGDYKAMNAGGHRRW